MPRREPVHGKARLLLEITTTNAKGKETSTLYTVRWLDPPDWATPAWVLTKGDGTAYSISVTAHGPVCDCPDFVYCRDHKDQRGCKHVAAIRATGLLYRSEKTQAGDAAGD